MFVLENKSQKLLSYNIDTCKQKYIDYKSNCQLMFIKKIFIVFDDDKIIAYNNEFISIIIKSYVIKIYILLNKTYISYLQKDKLY